MKIDDLIKALEEQKKVYGNVDVCLFEDAGSVDGWRKIDNAVARGAMFAGRNASSLTPIFIGLASYCLGDDNTHIK